MSLRKRWPNEAENARMDAVTRARSIKTHVDTMLSDIEKGKTVSSLELSIRLSRILQAASAIETSMIEAGDRKFAN